MVSKTSILGRLIGRSWLHVLVLATLTTTAVADDDDGNLVIRAFVPAALGGTFWDDPDNPASL